MKNAAGDYNCVSYVPIELNLAGINVIRHEFLDNNEVPQVYSGELCGWTFKRAWRYWICSGPELPFEYATPMHKLIGKEVRVFGHCGCPDPEDYCKESNGVNLYHVDSQEGLNILAAVLRKWERDKSA